MPNIGLTGVWNICWSHNSPDLLHTLQVRTQTSVHCEDLLVDDSRNGETVEAVGKSLPELDVVATLACSRLAVQKRGVNHQSNAHSS